MTRKEFLRAAAGAAAFGAAFPSAGGGRRVKASDRVNIGVIGCGTQAYDNVGQLLQDPRAQITVVCDPVLEAPLYSYAAHKPGGRAVFKRIVDERYGAPCCRMTADWREVIADPTVDAVFIITPDHWHARMAIAAMKAGKHVYCQKPLTLTISEGKEMVRVAEETGVTFQTGNQGRSSSKKRVAAELVINGYLGDCKRCLLAIPGGSGGAWKHGTDTTRRERPAWFKDEAMWNLWQGPAEHWENNAYIPGIHEPMCWRWNKRYGGGMIPDFGAHEFDTLHWAIGMDRSGPVAVENMKFGGWQPDREVFTWAGEFEFDLVYANGFRCTVKSVREGLPRGLRFYGEKGELAEISGKSLELPEHLRKWNEKRDLKEGEIHLYKPENGHSHESDFLDGIYAGRPCNSTCEIGHRTITAAHIVNIAQRLGVSSITWDPVKECFPDNDAANRMM